MRNSKDYKSIIHFKGIFYVFGEYFGILGHIVQNFGTFSMKLCKFKMFSRKVRDFIMYVPLSVSLSLLIHCKYFIVKIAKSVNKLNSFDIIIQNK